MIHHYVMILINPAGEEVRHEKQISGQEVAKRTNGKLGGMGQGDRLDFLELINRWNRLGSGMRDHRYQYIAGDSVHE